ncbi:membrane protein [Clostridia bacterium]|nr:membrane protein [Clostridia bacterium]
MKKFVTACLSLVMAATMFGCAAKEEKFELALITDLGTIDDKSFNQGSWEGLAQYAEEKKISHKYYQPSEQSDDAYLTAIDLAVKGGAKVVVTPGFLFETPVYVAQDRYPDVNFILIDGSPHDANYNYKTSQNAVGVSYAEEQAGFLAGYAAVKDGYRKLGFVGGMAVPAVVRYGYGFVQGADAAGFELGLSKGSISINYHYTGAFVASPEAQSLSASWYNDGVEVIFACGGAVGNSVMAAAEQSGKKVIGVDVDQSKESETVITSALKGLKASVYDCLKKYYDKQFPGGQDLVYAAENDGVGLVVDTAKFNSFSKADYDAIFAKLKANEIFISNDTDQAVTALPLAVSTVTEVK